MGFKKLYINIIMSSLFVFGFMTFVILVQLDNNASEVITDNQLINSTYGDLSTNLTSSETTAQSSLETFGENPPTAQLGELDTTSVISPTKLFRGLSIGTYNILIKLPMSILGVPPIVASVISSIIILLLIIGAWAILKGAIR